MANFYTDTIKRDLRFQSTDVISDIALLEPVTRAIVQTIISDADAHGFKLMVFETYRSQARQQLLYDRGATQLRQVGVHHYGLACDLVRDVGGTPSWKGDFSLLGRLAHQHKMIWGGDWGDPAGHHSFVDECHVQRCSLARQAALFRESWYPDATYDPYSDTEQALIS